MLGRQNYGRRYFDLARAKSRGRYMMFRVVGIAVLWGITLGTTATATAMDSLFSRFRNECQLRLTANRPDEASTSIRLARAPVVTQCGPSCRMESYLAHLGRARGVRFSSDYLNVMRLQDFGSLETPDRIGGGDAPDYEAWRLNGLVPHDAFAYPVEFVKELRRSVKLLSLGGFVTNPTLLLAEKVRRIDDELSRADPARGSVLRSERAALFERALNGLDPKVDPIRSTRDHINYEAILEFLVNHVNAPVDGVDRALDVIMAEIGQGRNVILYYTSSELTTGFGSILRERFGRKRQPVNVDQPGSETTPAVGHALVIEGYDHDHNGHITSLWLRDSNGPRSGDQGHLQMPIDIFRRYALGVFTIAD